MGEVRRLPHDDHDGRLTLGMAFFLASWGVMFAGLIVAYAILRAAAPAWPPPGEPRLPLLLPTLGTLVLGASSVVLERAVRAVKAARLAPLLPGISTALGLGVGFVALQLASWIELWREGLSTRGTYGGTFYVITWFHGVHVLAGLAVLVWLLAGARRGRFGPRSLAPLRLMAMAWHFLGISWLVIFLGVYVA